MTKVVKHGANMTMIIMEEEATTVVINTVADQEEATEDMVDMTSEAAGEVAAIWAAVTVEATEMISNQNCNINLIPINKSPAGAVRISMKTTIEITEVETEAATEAVANNTNNNSNNTISKIGCLSLNCKETTRNPNYNTSRSPNQRMRSLDKSHLPCS